VIPNVSVKSSIESAKEISSKQKKQVLIPPEKCTTLFLQSPIKSIVQTNWNQSITLKEVDNVLQYHLESQS
jgi:hypothetical protein